MGKIRKIRILSKLSKAVYFRYEVKNHDINVVKQAKIPKFSKLDGIGTPLKLIESFFGDALVDMIVGYTKLYGHREKANTNLENL